MQLAGDLSRVRITSTRLTLTAFTAADAADSFAALTDRVALYMSWNPPQSEADYRAIWRRLIADMAAGRRLSLVMRLTQTQEFIGMTGLDPADGALLETGLWIKEGAWGRGYGHETIAAATGWASGVFQPAGFLYPVVDENVASCRIAEALGGEITGTRPRQKPGEAVRTLLLYRIPAPGGNLSQPD